MFIFMRVRMWYILYVCMCEVYLCGVLYMCIFLSIWCIYVWSVCLRACACMCTYSCSCVLLFHSLPYSLETGSRTEPGTRLVVSKPSQSSVFALHSTEVTDARGDTCLLHGCWKYKLESLSLLRELSYLPSHLQAPRTFVLLSDLVVGMELQAALTFQVFSWDNRSLPSPHWSPILFP